MRAWAWSQPALDWSLEPSSIDWMTWTIANSLWASVSSSTKWVWPWSRCFMGLGAENRHAEPPVPHYHPLTVELLNAPKVVFGQLEVVDVHPLVEWCHDGAGVARVLQPQCMAQLVHCYQEEAVSCHGGQRGQLWPGPGPGHPTLWVEGPKEPAHALLSEVEPL